MGISLTFSVASAAAAAVAHNGLQEIISLRIRVPPLLHHLVNNRPQPFVHFWGNEPKRKGGEGLILQQLSIKPILVKSLT